MIETIPPSVIAIGSLVVSIMTALGVLLSGISSYRQANATRKTAARAEAKAETSAAELTTKLDGQLTLFRQTVRDEAEERIKAAEEKVKHAFLAGMERQRGDDRPLDKGGLR